MEDKLKQCKYCINRNKIKKDGDHLVQAIEKCGASEELTDAVILASEFIELALKESGNKFDCQNKDCEVS